MAVPNTGLAQVSNVTLVLAIMLYAVAMLVYACDLAFGKRRAATATPSGQRPERVEAVALVGAASGAEAAGRAFPADPGDPSEQLPRKQIRLCLHHQVQKPRLVPQSHRFGFVDRRDADDPQIVAMHRIDGGL